MGMLAKFSNLLPLQAYLELLSFTHDLFESVHVPYSRKSPHLHSDVCGYIWQLSTLDVQWGVLPCHVQGPR